MITDYVTYLLFFSHHSWLVISSTVGRWGVTHRTHHGSLLLGNHCSPTWHSALDNDGFPSTATASSATADAATDAQNHYPNRHNNRHPHKNMKPVCTKWESVLLRSLQGLGVTTVGSSKGFTAVVRAPLLINIRC